MDAENYNADETREMRDEELKELYHTMEVEEVEKRLVTNINEGLDTGEAELRIEEYGPNELKGDSGIAWWKILLENFINPLTFVLCLGAIASFVAAGIDGGKEWIEGLVIVFVIIFNSLVGFFQEYRSEKTMESLKKMSSPMAEVIRDGEPKRIPSHELVPGDIVFLKHGDSVPADVRFFETVNLEIDEALITGESAPVAKGTKSIENEDEALGDRFNMGFMTTIVTKGRGSAIVVHTGEDTEIGEIAKSLKEAGGNKKTQLQKKLALLAYFLMGGAVFSGVFVFVISIINRVAIEDDTVGDVFSAKEIWMYVISVAVAIIPEGLIAVLTVTQAFGVHRMAQRNAVVRKLTVLEALSAVNNICSDKTGTLTEGKMVATDLWIGDTKYTVSGRGIDPEGEILKDDNPLKKEDFPQDLDLAIRVCSLCNMAKVKKDPETGEVATSGDPTETALQVLATKVGMAKPTIEKNYKFVAEMPFDSQWKRKSVLYRDLEVAGELEKDATPSALSPNTQAEESLKKDDGKYNILLLKGAPEATLSVCTKYQVGDVVESLPADFENQMKERVSIMAARGLRVLGLAYRRNVKYDHDYTREMLDQELVFLGLVGIYDPPRPETKGAVERSHRSGITVHMVTGDHPLTAAAISREVSIIDKNAKQNLVMKGVELDHTSFYQLDHMELPRVVARCNPKSKVKLINALHRRKRFVVMTGDGVNDAPAIKYADVGIAMGIAGSEVTKQAADIVLMDDNFSTILAAIEEGRRIFSNIQKFVLYLMTNNVAEVMVLLFGLFFSFFLDEITYPMSPLQILWLNLVTDSPAALGLGMEPPAPDVMDEPPRTRKQGLFRTEVILDIAVYGSILGVICLINFGLILFAFGDPDQIEDLPGADGVRVWVYRARGCVFATQTIAMLFHALTCRHRRRSIFRMNPISNKIILFSWLGGIIILIPLFYIPYVNTILFAHYMLGWQEWILIIVGVAIFMICAELYKLLKLVDTRVGMSVKINSFLSTPYNKRKQKRLRKREEYRRRMVEDVRSEIEDEVRKMMSDVKPEDLDPKLKQKLKDEIRQEMREEMESSTAELLHNSSQGEESGGITVEVDENNN